MTAIRGERISVRWSVSNPYIFVGKEMLRTLEAHVGVRVELG